MNDFEKQFFMLILDSKKSFLSKNPLYGLVRKTKTGFAFRDNSTFPLRTKKIKELCEYHNFKFNMMENKEYFKSFPLKPSYAHTCECFEINLTETDLKKIEIMMKLDQ